MAVLRRLLGGTTSTSGVVVRGLTDVFLSILMQCHSCVSAPKNTCDCHDHVPAALAHETNVTITNDDTIH